MTILREFAAVTTAQSFTPDRSSRIGILHGKAGSFWTSDKTLVAMPAHEILGQIISEPQGSDRRSILINGLIAMKEHDIGMAPEGLKSSVIVQWEFVFNKAGIKEEYLPQPAPPDV